MRSLLLALFLLAGAWSALAAVAPVVPGYERLKREHSGTGTEAGEVLLSELSCLACHGERTAAPAPLLWKSGPDLSAAGDRLRPAYVRAYLAEPSALKPGTTMPHLLDGKDAGAIEDLAQYILSLRGQHSPAVDPPGATAEKGDDLFKSIGCIACHQEVPLEKLAEKYQPGELARFLAKPLAVRPAARMPDLHLSGDEAVSLAAFLAPQEPAAEPAFVPDDRAIQRGKSAFTSLGCVNCHAASVESKPAPWKNLQAGCLADAPPANVPHYPLSADQRTALRAALEARGPGRQAQALEPGAAIKKIMLQRNCFACHQRDQLGGPTPEMAENFTSTREDLGDLGRLPPPLDGAGRKFQPVALASILRGQDPVRKYMRVRMGDFGEELSRHLPELLATADHDPKEEPTIGQVDPSKVGRNEPGRNIVGTGGYACIACHDLHGHASLGIGAYDLAEMPKRLRPEWMRDFLLNPPAFPTGSRMPSFFAGKKPLNPKLGGDSARQIDAIRVYLTEADQSVPPPGFADSAAYEVKPTDRPVIFRTFMAGLGTHAIAIGFPAGVNAAFDAFEGRWGLAWRGRFLDADGTWNMRAQKMEKPLGEDLIQLGASGSLAISGQEKPGLKFHGYRVGDDGVPTFLYQLGALSIEDRLTPSDSHGLRRQLHVSGQTAERVTFTSQPPNGVTVQPANGTALEFKNGVADFTEEISW